MRAVKYGEPTDAIGMIVIAADNIQTRQPWTGIRVPVAANRSACAVGLYHGSQLIFWVAVLVVSNSLRASSLCEGHLVGLWLSNAGVSVASVYCLVGHLASCRSAPSKSICKYLAGLSSLARTPQYSHHVVHAPRRRPGSMLSTGVSKTSRVGVANGTAPLLTSTSAVP
jgi:hypothetical protein